MHPLVVQSSCEHHMYLYDYGGVADESVDTLDAVSRQSTQGVCGFCQSNRVYCFVVNLFYRHKECTLNETMIQDVVEQIH